MKTRKTIVSGVTAAIIAFAIMAGSECHSQTLEFLETKATVEGAIQLRWQSVPGAIYQVEYASQVDNGTTSWNVLKTQYPSQGTSTIWLDTGDYSKEPPVLHPNKGNQRFYRVSRIGDNATSLPTVQITSPANGSILSGETIVSVTANSTIELIGLKLYVDGEELDSSEDGTTWIVNTMEWPNGSHTLFATATVASQLPGAPGNSSITYSYGVSQQTQQLYRS